MAPLGMSFSLLTEDQGLVKVGLSAILDPFDSNQFMLCPRAMSFFQKLCPDPFPPVSKMKDLKNTTCKLNIKRNYKTLHPTTAEKHSSQVHKVFSNRPCFRP